MNNKKYLFNEAERLYIHEFKTVEEISSQLNLNRKTIISWKEQGDWDKKRCDFLKSKQSFHEELYEFARKLMKGISIDMDNGEKVDPGRMYAFCRIIPMFAKVKDYEDVMTQKESKDKSKKSISSDLIEKIEEEILGITKNDT